MPFEVACVCGETARGFRLVHHQVLGCVRCGQAVFVLPSSPLPLLDDEPTRSQPSNPTAPTPKFSTWRRPLLAGGITLVAVILLFVLLLNFLGRTPQPTASSPAADELNRHLAQGEAALAEGSFARAVDELGKARELRDRGQSMSLADGRRLQQLYRQADLLSGLLSDSLQTIVQQAVGSRRDEGEWQRQFADRYKGKAVIFDAEVRRDAAGELHLDYLLQIPQTKARIDLQSLKLLRTLPLDQPRRLLFGARLESVVLEPEDTWVIRFDAESGVLMTDANAVAACGLPEDEDSREVLRRQVEWLSQLP